MGKVIKRGDTIGKEDRCWLGEDMKEPSKILGISKIPVLIVYVWENFKVLFMGIYYII
jgi:hypothetical protein